MLPCGTPERTGDKDDKELCMETQWNREVK